MLGTGSTHTWEQLFQRPELFLFLSPSRNLWGLKQFPNLGGGKEFKAKNPSFSISVLRKRTKPTTGKCCFFLKYSISLLLLVGKRRKKLIGISPHSFLLLGLTRCPGFLAREGSLRGSAGEASKAVHFEAAARA